MRILAPALLTWLTSCVAADELTQGVAIWPFVLSNDTSFEEIAHVRGGAAVIAVFHVDELYGLDELPVSGATGEARVGRRAAPLVQQQAGLYTVPLGSIPDLYAPAGTTAEATVLVDGATYAAEATTGMPLDVTIELDLHESGKKLNVPLPEGYEDSYDQVLAEVRDLDGTVTWSNVPETFREWLDFAASRFTPRQLEIPGTAFPDRDATYALSIFGVIRNREDATFSATLTSELSGFTTGSALAVPVRTAP